MKKSTGSSTRARSFVDTSGFYALLVMSDSFHSRAGEILKRAARYGGRFVTSDYVLDESATLLRARGHGHLTEALFRTVFASAACEIEWMDSDRFERTRQFFAKHHDKSWSFTDCFSFLVMRDFGMRDALSSDAHFRQAGFNPLLV
jgi:predicted nucleic acid-binding protein